MPTEILPPHNIEAEEAVIGSCFLLATEGVDNFREQFASIRLKPSDFFREKNAWWFEAILNVYKSGRPPDQILVCHEMNRLEQLEKAGGPAFIYHYLGAVATSLHLKYYADIVFDCSRRRQEISRAGRIAADAYMGKLNKDVTGWKI